MPPCETLAAATFRPISKALAARVELAHPLATFYPYTFGLCGGAVVIAAALIRYNVM
jgi:hypothetical protein